MLLWQSISQLSSSVSMIVTYILPILSNHIIEQPLKKHLQYAPKMSYMLLYFSLYNTTFPHIKFKDVMKYLDAQVSYQSIF